MPTTLRKGAWGPAVGVFVLVGSVGASRLIDGAFQTMHRQGGVSGSATWIASPQAVVGREDRIAVIEEWWEWHHEVVDGVYVAPDTLLRYYLAADLVTAVSLTALAVALFVWLLGRLADGDGPRLSAVRGLATSGLIAVGAYLAADVAETWLLFVTGRTAKPASGAILAVGIASWVKWLALGFAAVAAGVAGYTAWRRSTTPQGPWHRLREVGRPGRILRVQLALVAVMALLFVVVPGDLGQQILDAGIAVASSWGAASRVLAATIVLSVLLPATAIGSVILHTRQPKPVAGRRLKGWFVVIVAAVLVVVGFVWDWPPFPSVPVAALFVGLIALFSLHPGVWGLDPAPELVGLSETAAARGVTAGVPESVQSWIWGLAVLPTAIVGLLIIRVGVQLAIIRQAYAQVWGLLAILIATGLLFGLIWSKAAKHTVKWLRRPEEERGGDRWSWWPGLKRSGQLVVVGLGTPTVVVAILFGADVYALARYPIQQGQDIGPIPVVITFLATVLVTIWALHALALLVRKVPGIFAVLGLHRVPVLTLLALFAVVVSTVNTDGRYHDVEPLPNPPPTIRLASVSDGPEDGSRLATSTSLEAAFDDWLAQLPDDGSGDVVPLVLVAAAGGGIRAAYWTAAVLECASPPDNSDPVDGCPTAKTDASTEEGSRGHHVFAASGISGGSVGLAAWRAAGDGKRASRNLGDVDLLSPLLATLAFRDFPNMWLHIDDPWDDRARVHERALEDGVPVLACGFAATSVRRADSGDLGPDCSRPEAETTPWEVDFPLLMLHGIAIGDGCRVTSSIVDRTRTGTSGDRPGCLRLGLEAHATGANHPLTRVEHVFDHTCLPESGHGGVPRDIRLSTAAMLSARFPWVSPTGGLQSCDGPNETDRGGTRSFVLDGGFVEATGAEPLAELWPALEMLVAKHNGQQLGPRVVPRLLLIDNGYADTSQSAAARRPAELAAPLGISGRLKSTSASARQAAMIAVQRGAETLSEVGSHDDPCLDSVIAYVHPIAHPGPYAPLGWLLSKVSRDDLIHELTHEDNSDDFNRARAWFTGQPCVEGPDET